MLNEPAMGGTPWGFSFVYSPDGVLRPENSWQDIWKLAPRWHYVGWG